jgi:DNA-binding response OmpR family regulator
MIAKRRVLIVEDEGDVAGLIKYAVERGGELETEIVGSGDAALKAVSERPPDLVVLDLNLPVLDGVEVCRILRARTETRQLPIIILTARGTEDDRVRGLEIGADDYVSKPFSLRELTARVKAVLRRASIPVPGEAPSVIYRGARITADFDAAAVTVDGQPIVLTRREFELLRFLVQNTSPRRVT